MGRPVAVDVDLLRRASALTGHTDSVETVGAALEHLIALQRQVEALDAITGIGWDGDLDALRESRFPTDISDRS